MTTSSALFALVLLSCPPTPDKGQSVTISEAKKDKNGILVHEVQSPYQAGKTDIRVLLPNPLEKGNHYPVLYVLPVEAGNENRYGDGLLEVKNLGLHNKLQAIFVAPTFTHLPWYADHPTKADIRQEGYFLKVVVPLIEKTYPVQAEAGGRFLLGFSKSGWGAFSLLLRHPDVFGKAVAWDAPLLLEQPNRYGMGDIFGTQENFEKYQITKLLKHRADELQHSKRLVLLGYGNFRDHHEKAHALMQNLQIDHDYRDGPARKHDWHSGWLPEAVGLLVAVDTRDDRKKEQAMLEGTWAVTAEEWNGEAADVLKGIQFQDVKLIFAGDRITIQAPGREQTGTLQLDPSKNPKTLDIRYQSGASEERFFPGIYTVDGDTLKVCLGTDGQHRPREFATKPDAHVVRFVLQREKP